MAKLLRGQLAHWLRFGDTGDWTLLGVNEEELTFDNQPDVEQSKDVTGGSYTINKGYSPQTSLDYKANSTDSIYAQLEKIQLGLLKDDENTSFTLLEGHLNDEIIKGGSKALSGNAVQMGCKVVINSVGGDTGAVTYNISVYADDTVAPRVQGTVAVAAGGILSPTFTAQTNSTNP